MATFDGKLNVIHRDIKKLSHNGNLSSWLESSWCSTTLLRLRLLVFMNKMSNVENPKIPALKITGENYIQWTGFVKRRLKSLGALEAIKEGNKCTDEIKAKADEILHLHIDEMLEFEFCGQTVTDSDMLEKTLSTFHASNINLHQQYRLQNFKRYSDLNVNHFVTEKNNELLMKNHQSRPTGSLAIPEVNVVNNTHNRNSGNKRGRVNPCGHGHGLGHYDHNRFSNQNHSYHRDGYNGRGRDQRNYTYHAPQGTNQKNNEVGTFQNHEGVCFRCGSANHWAKSCTTATTKDASSTSAYQLYPRWVFPFTT